MPDSPEFLVVGRVERPHGLTGEVSVSIRTDFPERFEPGGVLEWRRGGESRALTLSAVRRHGHRLLVVFEGVADVDGARRLAGGELGVPAGEAFPAPDGYFYEHQIRGLVCEGPSGRRLGIAVALESTPAGPLLSVEVRPGRLALVPFVDGIVVAVDRPGRRIVLDPPEGLMELADG